VVAILMAFTENDIIIIAKATVKRGYQESYCGIFKPYLGEILLRNLMGII
jgi:hypothetical protein